MGYQYGGTDTETPAPRRGRGPNKKPLTGCGTPAGYATHERHKTTPCLPCTDARNAYKRELWQARKKVA